MGKGFRGGGGRVGGGSWGGSHGTSQKAKMAAASACPSGLSNSSGGSADSAPGYPNDVHEQFLKDMSRPKRCWWFFTMMEENKAKGRDMYWTQEYYNKWVADCPMDRIAELAERFRSSGSRRISIYGIPLRTNIDAVTGHPSGSSNSSRGSADSAPGHPEV